VQQLAYNRTADAVRSSEHTLSLIECRVNYELLLLSVTSFYCPCFGSNRLQHAVAPALSCGVHVAPMLLLCFYQQLS
jgi:hypothetical protein